MNRRSWFKSVLATITIAISDGLPKALVSDPIRVPPRKMKAVWSIEPYLNPKFEQLTDYEILDMVNEISKEIYSYSRKRWCLLNGNNEPLEL